MISKKLLKTLLLLFIFLNICLLIYYVKIKNNDESILFTNNDKNIEIDFDYKDKELHKYLNELGVLNKEGFINTSGSSLASTITLKNIHFYFQPYELQNALVTNKRGQKYITYETRLNSDKSLDVFLFVNYKLNFPNVDGQYLNNQTAFDIMHSYLYILTLSSSSQSQKKTEDKDAVLSGFTKNNRLQFIKISRIKT